MDLEAVYDDTYFTPKGTLEWRPNDDQMWYGSIAQGSKPGGITTVAAGTFFDPENSTFDEEKLVAYEIGGKTTWAEGTVQINGAVFFQDYTDKQVGVTKFDTRSQTDVGSIENAGEAEIWGVELEAQWQINDYWFTSLGYTWLDAEYTEFESLTGSANEIARNIVNGNGGCLELVDTNPDPDAVTSACLVDRTGNKIEDVPEHSFLAYGKFTLPVRGGEMEMFVDGNIIYTDERFSDENNVKWFDSYWLMDLRAGLTSSNWEVVFFVDNVFDDDTVKTGNDNGSQVETTRWASFPPGPRDGIYVTLPDPRVVGIRGKYRFGG